MKKTVSIILIIAVILGLGISVLNGDENSSSLSYTLNLPNKDDYSLSGIGNFTGASLVIPSSYNGKPVVAISERAFENVQTLTSVQIPETIKQIGKFAFSNCKKLQSVQIMSGVSNIGLGAFYNCTGLSSISIPSSVSSIGDWAFYNCAKLGSISLSGKSVTLGVGAFSSCSSLSDINITGGVSLLPQYCFADCVGLKKITIPSSVQVIGEFAFADCYNLSEITVLGDGLTGLDAQSFYGVSATIKYSCINDSLNALRKDNYGGRLTWRKHINFTHVARVEPTMTKAGNIEYWVCSDCGKLFADAAGTKQLGSMEYIIPAGSYIRGDVDANQQINEDDAILALYHLFFGDKYPVNQDLDFNGDKAENEDDVIHLLYYIFFGDKYPLAGN